MEHPAVPDTDQSATPETLYLVSIPGLADRLVQASTAPDDDFIDASDMGL
ncbi:MAG: hypothetical protein ACI4MK_00215 [Aristaeellaceae bacterium]